ncbi:YqiA/YcfP family alpha/beta fold hydrolase [Aliiglaciecola sp. LCG003]|uniref:YqiA/YcfP family alpha/beta fold hydrolase n=1 Tax=Aliiglaciecola sp. LCG003 TaxID=3053655 RepID=UPI002573149C|nr:YqiA/YcfP family alpha/beta fold hydrolase [Aliiglaciecola sp. LCG003]WJG08934.1 YqiA/YcfP family alpha/beta fold hydrolase [Aliiglaciecola sp. LCG003]
MQDVLIYIHGFLSSPQSVKSQQTVKYINEHYPNLLFEAPQVPNYPDQAIALLEDIVSAHQGKKLGFIGSSMGGFMATYLVEKYGGKAVLINPAVKPFELLIDYLGDHVNPYTGMKFTLSPTHIDQLKALDSPIIHNPRNYWALLQTGDETLDYRQAQKRYANSKLTIEEGGDHSFTGYPDYLADIFTFLFDKT